jgi:ribosomal protein S18
MMNASCDKKDRDEEKEKICYYSLKVGFHYYLQILSNFISDLAYISSADETGLVSKRTYGTYCSVIFITSIDDTPPPLSKVGINVPPFEVSGRLIYKEF